MDPVDILRVLLNADRLAIAGALAVRPMTIDEVATATGRDRRLVLETIAELRSAGLVLAHGDRFEVDRAELRRLAESCAEAVEPMDPLVGYGMTDEERAVLTRYFRGRSLAEIPAARGKRHVVLQRLALEFEPGRHYAEREVNAMLCAFHPDAAALRRYLVDDGFLDRAHVDGVSTYWRSGGRVSEPKRDAPD